MKVVKVTRKWRVWKHGHTVALRFVGWHKEARRIEDYCRETMGGSGWHSMEGPWASWYGKSHNSSDPRPYFISFRDESAVSMILLMTNLK